MKLIIRAGGMELNDYSLRQMDENDIRKLPEAALRDLAVKLLQDLKEARERLNKILGTVPVRREATHPGRTSAGIWKTIVMTMTPRRRRRGY